MKSKIVSAGIAIMLVMSVFSGVASAAPDQSDWSASSASDTDYYDSVVTEDYVYGLEIGTDEFILEKRYRGNGSLVWSESRTPTDVSISNQGLLEVDHQRGGVLLAVGSSASDAAIYRFNSDGSLGWKYDPSGVYGVNSLDYNQSADTVGVSFRSDSSNLEFEVFNIDPADGTTYDVSNTGLKVKGIAVTGQSEFVYATTRNDNYEIVRYDSSSNTEVESFTVDNPSSPTVWGFERIGDTGDFLLGGDNVYRTDFSSVEWEQTNTDRWEDPEVVGNVTTAYNVYNSTALNISTGEVVWDFEPNGAYPNGIGAYESGGKYEIYWAASSLSKYKEPVQVTSIEIDNLGDSYVVGDEQQLSVTAYYDDGTTKDVTEDASYSSSNSSRMSVNSTGYIEALDGGSVSITVEYTGSNGNTVTDTQETEVIPPVSHVEFNVSDTNPTAENDISMSATLVYEDGSTKDITSDISNSTTSSSRPAVTNFDFQNKTVNFTGTGNVTLQFSNTYQGTEYSDTVDVNVEPTLSFDYYNSLSPTEQIFVIFTDWGFLAILASLLASGMIAYQMNPGAGMASLTILLSLSWIGGLVSIFVPATLVIFEVFIVTVLDVQLADF